MWCPFCQQAARELAAVKDQLNTFGAQVLLVYRDELATVRNSCSERGLPFDCLSDSARELENATELNRISIGRYAAFSPAKLLRSLRAPTALTALTGVVSAPASSGGIEAEAEAAANGSVVPQSEQSLWTALASSASQPGSWPCTRILAAQCWTTRASCWATGPGQRRAPVGCSTPSVLPPGSSLPR
jgi:hypothetical protein